MSFHIIPKVGVGETSWGNIYGLQLNTNFSESANSLSVNYINQTGEYPVPNLGLSKPYTLTFPGLVGVSQWYPISYSKEDSSQGKTLEIKFIDSSWILDKTYVGLHNRHGNRTGENILDSLILVGNEVNPCDRDMDGIMDITDFPDVATNCRPAQISGAYIQCDPLALWNIFDVNYCFPELLSGISGKKIKYNLNGIETGNVRYRKAITGPLREVLKQWGNELAFTYVWQDNKIEFINIASGFNIPAIDRTEKKYISKITESVSLEGTVKKDYISYYARNGDPSPQSEKGIGFMNLFPVWLQDLLGAEYDGTRIYNWEIACAINHVEGGNDLSTAYWWLNTEGGYGMTSDVQARTYVTDPRVFQTPQDIVLRRLGNLRIYGVISPTDSNILGETPTEGTDKRYTVAGGHEYPAKTQTVTEKSNVPYNYDSFKEALPTNMGFQNFEQFKAGGGYFCIVYLDDQLVSREQNLQKSLANNFIGKYFILKTSLGPGNHDFNAPDSVTYYPGGAGVRNMPIFQTVSPVPGTFLGDIAVPRNPQGLFQGAWAMNTGESESVILLERGTPDWWPNEDTPELDAFINYYKYKNYKIVSPGKYGQIAIDSIKELAKTANANKKDFNENNIQLIACWPGYFTNLDRVKNNPLTPRDYFTTTEGGAVGLMSNLCRVLNITTKSGLLESEKNAAGTISIWTPAQALNDIPNTAGYAPGYRVRYAIDAINWPIPKVQDILVSTSEDIIDDDKILNYDISYHDISDNDFKALWHTSGTTLDTWGDTGTYYKSSSGGRDVQRIYKLRNQNISGTQERTHQGIDTGKASPQQDHLDKFGNKITHPLATGQKVQVIVLASDVGAYCSSNTGMLMAAHRAFNTHIPASITGESRELFVTTVGEPLTLKSGTISEQGPGGQSPVSQDTSGEISFKNGLVSLSVSYGEGGLHYDYTFRNKPYTLPSQEFIYKQIELSKPKVPATIIY